MKVFGYERFPDGALVGGRGGEAESGDHAVRVYHQRHLEPVNPLGLGGAPPEARLPAEKPLARSPHPHDRRDEGGVQDSVDGRRFAEVPGEGPLHRARTSGSRARTLRLNWLWVHRFGK